MKGSVQPPGCAAERVWMLGVYHAFVPLLSTPCAGRNGPIQLGAMARFRPSCCHPGQPECSSSVLPLAKMSGAAFEKCGQPAGTALSLGPTHTCGSNAHGPRGEAACGTAKVFASGRVSFEVGLHTLSRCAARCASGGVAGVVPLRQSVRLPPPFLPRPRSRRERRRSRLCAAAG